MSADFFDGQMARLAVLRFAPAEIDGHREALADLPTDVLEAAVSHALRTRTHFPVPAELRADADCVAVRPSMTPDLGRENILQQPFTITIPQIGTVVSVTKEWQYCCEDCSDCGWMTWWCGSPAPKPWMQTSRCERYWEHPGHEFVKHCACYMTNPSLVRKRDAQRRYSEAPKRAA